MTMQISPETHMQNAQGDWVRIENIKPRDLLEDQLVKGISPKFEAMQEQMAALKEQTYADIAAFISLSMEQYGVKVGGEKGNITLTSFDGSIKVQRSRADHLTFNEGILAAQALINECLAEWTEDSRPELRTIIERAFKQDKEGNVSIPAVLDLRNLNINDERWQRAMSAIGDALKRVFAKTYIRVSKGDGKGGWKNITLDFAKL